MRCAEVEQSVLVPQVVDAVSIQLLHPVASGMAAVGWLLRHLAPRESRWEQDLLRRKSVSMHLKLI